MSPESHPLVSILIVTWNRRHELERCIRSALSQSYRPTEIVVVDNHSSDGTAEAVREQFPEVRLVPSPVNLGCPSGRNLGFTHCRGRYIYMLDDDGWLSPAAVEISVQRAESNPAIGVVMSRIHEMQDGVEVRQRPPGLDHPVFLSEFSGGCSLIRRDVLRQVGAFPEDFFRQGEEGDLALRMLQAGYYCFLEPNSVMYHAPSASGRSHAANLFYGLRNTSRTGLRLWPFPWCLARPLVNLIHALRGMVTYRDPGLPWRLVRQLALDLARLRGQRRPVRPGTLRLFRHLARNPSTQQPQGGSL